MKRPLSSAMRGMIWDMLRTPSGPTVVMLNDERTIQALVRRGILRAEKHGYRLDRAAARKALNIGGRP